MFIPPSTAPRRRVARRPWAWRAAAALALACAASTTGAAAELPQAPAAMLASLQPGDASPADDTAIRERIESTAGLAIAGEKLHGALLRQFYAAHNYQPVWPSHEAQANALLAAVMRAGEHGLDPGLFHAALLRTPAALSPLDRELLLSDAFLAYADALARGVLPVEIRMDDEDLRPEPVDVAAVLDSAIASPDPASAVEALAPHTAAYLALRQALQAYRTEAGTALPEPQPAAAHDGRRLAAEWTPAARVREIEINLERLRWLPRQMPPDRVRVNTATAELELYRADRPVTAMRVVVGQFDKQTPEFATTIDSILFHPPWLVPPSIARSEILPKLDRDPGYLARHHMIWRRNGGIEQLPPSALGRLKFEMADRFDVYLHDTPERFLFARADRRKSHGCVRVQHPRELAALLLQQPLAYVDHEIAITGTHSRPLPAAMPVYIVYQTAFLDSAGKIEFVPDVYQRDAEVWQHLHPMEQAPMAVHAPALERKG